MNIYYKRIKKNTNKEMFFITANKKFTMLHLFR